jgi:xanthine dehydrogenase accessory factor
MNDFHRILSTMKEKKAQKLALATIIRVDGSSYRREGAKMLFSEDGSCCGTISAGCLEEDLIYHAQEVMQTSKAKTVIYDLKSVDDLSWGQGAGCDGEIEVLVEAIEWESEALRNNQMIWPCIDKIIEQGKSVIFVKSVRGKLGLETQLLFSNQGLILSGEKSLKIQQSLIPYFRQLMDQGLKAKLFHIPELQSDFFFEHYTPKELLYIFGAGPDAEPLAKLASQVGFSVTVIDPRSSRCNEENFPTADYRIIEHPESYLMNNRIPFHGFVLVMTHNFNWDQQILKHLLESPLYYLGILGPKRRSERLNANKPLPNFIHSPIGLEIGADGPEEISISVIAQLIKARNEIVSAQVASMH